MHIHAQMQTYAHTYTHAHTRTFLSGARSPAKRWLLRNSQGAMAAHSPLREHEGTIPYQRLDPKTTRFCQRVCLPMKCLPERQWPRWPTKDRLYGKFCKVSQSPMSLSNLSDDKGSTYISNSTDSKADNNTKHDSKKTR